MYKMKSTAQGLNQPIGTFYLSFWPIQLWVHRISKMFEFTAKILKFWKLHINYEFLTFLEKSQENERKPGLVFQIVVPK